MPSKVPTIRQVAWLSLVPQLVILAALVLGTTRAMEGRPEGTVLGAALYIMLSQGLRRVVAANHLKGMGFVKRGQLDSAIPYFEASYAFFSRYPWIDRFRFLTLLSSSAYSYREMALYNIAFLNSQIGQREKALQGYRRALAEFPESSIVQSALRMMETTSPQDAPVEIRKGRPEDAAMLTAFAARIFDETYTPHNTAEDMRVYMEANFSLAKQSRELADPGMRTFLAMIGGELAGYAQVRDSTPPPEVPPGKPMEVARFYVDSRWQGRGLAARLMEACFAEARSEGREVIWLGVWTENARAIRFYEKQGFRIVGRIPFVLGTDPQEDHLMVRPL